MPIHKRHFSARAGVLALLQFSITPWRDYACGCKITAALTGAESYHFWIDIKYFLIFA